MTAVPAQRTKTKDSFQLELDKEIEKRKSRGLSTGFTDDEKSDEIDEAYSDDFEDDLLSSDDSDDELLREYLNETTPLKSARAKETDQAAPKKDDSFFPSNENSVSLQKSPVFSLERQAALDQTNTAAAHDGDSFLNFLKSDTKSNSKILKIHKAEDSDASEHSLSRPGSTKKKVTFNPTSSQFSPRRDVISPILASNSETSDKQSLISGKTQSLSTMLQKDEDKKEELSPRASPAAKPNQSESLSTRFDIDNKHTFEAQSLLTKTFRPRDNTFLDSKSAIDDILKGPKPIPRKSSLVEEEPIKPQPRARRRHGSNTSSMSDESQVRTTTKSPDLQQLPEEVKTESQIKNVTDVDLPFMPSTSKLNALPRVTENKEVDQEKDKQFSTIPAEKPLPSKKLVHTDSDMSSSTEDLLAQLQAAADGSSPAKKQPADVPLDVSKAKARNEPSVEILAAATEAAEASANQQSVTQLPHDVKGDDGVDQETYVVKPAEAQQGEQLNLTYVKSKKLTSTRKSPRTPPASYKGLGSLNGLQQLQTFRPDDPLAKTTSNNVRSTVYLQWLADREKKLKERKKLKLMAEEKENGEKEKQLQEKKLEDISARKAWVEQKKDVLKEQAQKKRKEERRLKREKERKEEEKRNSARKADIVREKALAEAKRKHREEMRKKRQEERIEKQKKKEREDESQKKLNEWMEKRSKQWEADRKKEIREKKAKEKEIKKLKEEKNRKGEDSFATWREKKEEQEKGRRRLNVHDEERPPWSPANKVIPRVR